MSVFEPILGVVVGQIYRWAYERFPSRFSPEFPERIGKAFEEWHSSVPDDIKPAILISDSLLGEVSAFDAPHFPAWCSLRDAIQTGIPTPDQWTAALIERRKAIQAIDDGEPDNFFKATNDEVAERHLKELGRALQSVCEQDKELREREMLRLLRELLQRWTNVLQEQGLSLCPPEFAAGARPVSWHRLAAIHLPIDTARSEAWNEFYNLVIALSMLESFPKVTQKTFIVFVNSELRTVPGKQAPVPIRSLITNELRFVARLRANLVRAISGTSEERSALQESSTRKLSEWHSNVAFIDNPYTAYEFEFDSISKQVSIRPFPVHVNAAIEEVPLHRQLTTGEALALAARLMQNPELVAFDFGGDPDPNMLTWLHHMASTAAVDLSRFRVNAEDVDEWYYEAPEDDFEKFIGREPWSASDS